MMISPFPSRRGFSPVRKPTIKAHAVSNEAAWIAGSKYPRPRDPKLGPWDAFGGALWIEQDQIASLEISAVPSMNGGTCLCIKTPQIAGVGAGDVEFEVTLDLGQRDGTWSGALVYDGVGWIGFFLPNF